MSCIRISLDYGQEKWGTLVLNPDFMPTLSQTIQEFGTIADALENLGIGEQSERHDVIDPSNNVIDLAREASRHGTSVDTLLEHYLAREAEKINMLLAV